MSRISAVTALSTSHERITTYDHSHPPASMRLPRAGRSRVACLIVPAPMSLKHNRRSANALRFCFVSRDNATLKMSVQSHSRIGRPLRRLYRVCRETGTRIGPAENGRPIVARQRRRLDKRLRKAHLIRFLFSTASRNRQAVEPRVDIPRTGPSRKRKEP